MSEFQFKVSSASQRPQRLRLAADATLGDLKEKIAGTFGISQDKQKLLAGFPPSVVEESRDLAPLKAVFPSGREAITVQEQEASGESEEAAAQPESGERLGVVRVPSDNSCLFACVAQALGLARPSDGEYSEALQKMRRIISGTILQNPALYSEAVLGRAVDDYCAWIEDAKSWGGEIEMSILANHFDVTIVAVAVEDGQVYRYSGGLGLERAQGIEFAERWPLRAEEQPFCVLIYDGIHYDYIAAGGSGTFFGAPDEHEALKSVQQVAEQLRKEKAFVNVNSFALVCNQCGTQLVGQEAATEHAMKTGHTNFGQSS